MNQEKNYVISATLNWGDVDDYNKYPFNISAISSFKSIEFIEPITIFCGENGTGKSTLLEAISIALGLNSEGGSKNYMFSVKKTHSSLHEHLSLRRNLIRQKDSFFVRSDTMFNLFTEMDNLGDGSRYYEGKSLHERSHGESILTLISHRFREGGLYILDEPETGLSQNAQFTLAREILRLANSGSQFIIATHSPVLLFMPKSSVFEFDSEIAKIEPQDSLEWIILRRFIDNPYGTIDTYMRDLME
jgi:predicted ATPase